MIHIKELLLNFENIHTNNTTLCECLSHADLTTQYNIQ